MAWLLKCVTPTMTCAHVATEIRHAFLYKGIRPNGARQLRRDAPVEVCDDFWPPILLHAKAMM